MNSLVPLSVRSVEQAVAQADPAFSNAANDSVATDDGPQSDPLLEPEENDTHNPLWSIVIATAILFGALAALLTFS